jgi:predicted amino acid racemase
MLDQVTDIWNQQAEVCKKNLEAMEEHGTNISLMLLQIPKLKEQ